MSLEPQYILPLELLAIPVCLDQWQDGCLAASVCTRMFGLQALESLPRDNKPHPPNENNQECLDQNCEGTLQAISEYLQVFQIWKNGRILTIPGF